MAHSKHHNSPLAVTYAESLIDLAWERNIAIDINRELAGVKPYIN